MDYLHCILYTNNLLTFWGGGGGGISNALYTNSIWRGQYKVLFYIAARNYKEAKVQ